MENQNEKGGSQGSGRAKGSSNSEGPGKMNSGSSAGSGASGSSGRGGNTGSSGSSGTSGRGSDSGSSGSSGSSGRGSDSGMSGSSGTSGRGSGSGATGSSAATGSGSNYGSSGSSTGEGPGKMNTGSGAVTGASGTGGVTGSSASGTNYGKKTGDSTGNSYSTKSKSGSGNSQDGDGMLSDLGVNKNQILTALGVVAGGALLYKGAKALVGSGKDASLDKKAIINISTSLTVKRPKEELYAYWRNFENLPNFMSHIEDVRELSDKKSEWTAEIPGGIGTIEWEAEVIWEQKNHSIAWKSLPDSDIENSGEVRFQDAGNGKSTVVETRISYRPPAGKAGAMAAKLLNPAFKKVVENDLKEFKKVMESGGAKKGSASRW